MTTPDWKTKQPPVEDMFSPVRCNRCGAIYDLGYVKTGARYSDCTCFTTPCCGRQADDRTWKGSPDFQKLTRKQAIELATNPYGTGRSFDLKPW